MSQLESTQLSAPKYRQVAIVGVGLIGGSIGLALRQRGIAQEVIGIGRRQASLDRALACGTVDKITTDLEAGVSKAELTVVAAPVDRVPPLVREVAKNCPPEGLITDVGSVKGTICQELASLGTFVGSHPLAGDHRTGPEHARVDLLTGKLVLVTPVQEKPEVLPREEGTDGTIAPRENQNPEKSAGPLREIIGFWESLGARVEQLDPQEHDRAIATTSHLPHWVASALAGATPQQWLPMVASGWRDTTRVAAADADLWEQIFKDNNASLLESLDRFLVRLTQMRTVLEAGKPLSPLLNEAKRIRDAVGD